MKKSTSVFYLIIGIGVLSVGFSIYRAFTGDAFEDYFSGIFLGVTLIGTAIWYTKQAPSNDD